MIKGHQTNTEAEKKARMWFGEIPSCCSLTFLLGPACAWVLLQYVVLQAIFSGPVHIFTMQFNILQVNRPCSVLDEG